MGTQTFRSLANRLHNNKIWNNEISNYSQLFENRVISDYLSSSNSEKKRWLHEPAKNPTAYFRKLIAQIDGDH